MQAYTPHTYCTHYKLCTHITYVAHTLHKHYKRYIHCTHATYTYLPKVPSTQIVKTKVNAEVKVVDMLEYNLPLLVVDAWLIVLVDKLFYKQVESGTDLHVLMRVKFRHILY